MYWTPFWSFTSISSTSFFSALHWLSGATDESLCSGIIFIFSGACDAQACSHGPPCGFWKSRLKEPEWISSETVLWRDESRKVRAHELQKGAKGNTELVRKSFTTVTHNKNQELQQKKTTQKNVCLKKKKTTKNSIFLTGEHYIWSLLESRLKMKDHSSTSPCALSAPCAKTGVESTT